MKRPRLPIALLVLGVAAGTAACRPGGGSSQSDPAAQPAALVDAALHHSLPADAPLSIGVLIGPTEGRGSEFRPLIEGANLAAYRFGLGGTPVDLRVALDDGTPSGATDAVRSLLDGGVGAILVESQSDGHLDAALAEASAADCAVVMAYSQAGADGAWSLAPSATGVRAAIDQTLRDARLSKPYVVTGAQRQGPVEGIASGSAADPRAQATAVKERLDNREIDSVVVAASADEAAAFVTALEAALDDPQTLIFLTPEAMTPAFGDAVTASGASEGRLVTVGRAPAETTALTAGEAGDAASAFYAAMRMAASDPQCENIYKDDACATSIRSADATSHDAVVALVRAAEAAQSSKPARVRAALSALTVSTGQGLAVGTLDFRSYEAVPASQRRVLRATASDTGLAPQSGGAVPTLHWFGQ